MKVNLYVSIFSLLILFSCNSYQSTQRMNSHSLSDMPNEPGKCYAKCLTPDIVSKGSASFPIYFGEDEEIITNHVRQETIELAPKSTEWVKKKADRNCRSADPNDCLVWCLVEKPAQKITIENILQDTTLTGDFEIETFDLDIVASNGGQTVWMEVICNPSKDVITELQSKLTAEGYDLSVEMIQGIFGSASKSALRDYQKNNGLHIGGLTEETLKSFGIEL